MIGLRDRGKYIERPVSRSLGEEKLIEQSKGEIV